MPTPPIRHPNAHHLAALLSLSLIPATFAQTLPTSPDPAADQIRHTLQAIREAQAAGDESTLAHLLTATDPASLQPFVQATTRSARFSSDSRKTYQRLNDESQKAFGKPWIELPATLPAPVDPLQNATIAVHGDAATLTMKFNLPDGTSHAVTQEFRHIDNTWKLLITPIPPAMVEQLKTFQLRQQLLLAALNRTSDDIHAKKFATLDEARQASVDYAAQEDVRQNKATATQPADTLHWDFTKSHLRKDVDWPADTPAVSWMVGDDKPYQLDLQVPFLPRLTLAAKDIELSSGVTQRIWPTPGVLHPDQPLDSLTFALQDPLTTDQVRAFIDKLGMTDAFKKQLPDFPPANADRFFTNVNQQFEPEAGVVITLLNVRHLTGNKDDWTVTVRIAWGKQIPGYWK